MRSLVLPLLLVPLVFVNALACSSSSAPSANASPDAAAPSRTCTLDKSAVLPILAKPSKNKSNDVVYTSSYTAAQLQGESIASDPAGYVHLHVDQCTATFPKETMQGDARCYAENGTWIVSPAIFATSGTHVHLSIALSKHLLDDGSEVACTFTDGSPAVETHDDDL